MPQRLHRLEVRNKMLVIATDLNRAMGLGISGSHIISREAGYIDVLLSRVGGVAELEQIRSLFIAGLSREGIGVEAIDTTFERRSRKWRIRFQNDLMFQQAQWGARGMSRNYRVRNGIDADARPSDTTLVRTGGSPPYADDLELLRRERAQEVERLRRIRLQELRTVRPPLDGYGTTIHTAAVEVLEPLTEETQDEDDSGILTRMHVASVALEPSELG